MIFVLGISGALSAGFFGAEAAPGTFLGPSVGAWRAHRHEVAPVGDLGDQVVVKVGEVSGGKTPPRH